MTIEDPDQALYVGIVQREGRSLQRLLDKYAEPLMAVMWRHVNAYGQPDDLQDLLQQTAVRVWRSIDSFDSERGSLKTWLFQIGVSYAKEFRRKAARRHDLLADNTESIAGWTSTGNVSPLDSLECESIRIQLENALGKMSTADQELLLLYLDGWDHHGIAERLDEKVGTIRTRFHRAKKRLKKILLA